MLMVLAGTLLISGMGPVSRVEAACSAPATTYGSDTVNLSVPSAGTYTLWVRMQAPSTSSNQFMLQVNGGSCFNVGGNAAMPLNTWTWVNYQNGSSSQVMQASLVAGNNSLVLIGTQPKVVVDTVLALASSSCVPTGLGTNCTTSQTGPSTSGGSTTPTAGGSAAVQAIANAHLPAVALSSNGTALTPNGTTVQLSKPVVVSPAYVPGKTIKEARYYLNNRLVYTAKTSPYTYKLDTNQLLNGQYTLTATTVYTTGETASMSEKITISHPWYKNVAIATLNYWWLVLLTVALIGFGMWWVVFRRRGPVSLPAETPAQAPLPTPAPPTMPTQTETAVVQPGVYPPEEKTDL